MENKKPIGGYFELELQTFEGEYHKNVYRLNSARNALLFLLKHQKYTDIYVPFFTCGIVIDALQKHSISIHYYSIDKNLEIIEEDICLNKKAAVIYTNYFGIKDKYIDTIHKRFKNLIIDNSQAFYSKALKDVDTFYSPRKFFGIPDGGFLSTPLELNFQELPKDVSHKRFSHLLKRIDLGAQQGYSDFKTNDVNLKNLAIKQMSDLTTRLLKNIDYSTKKNQRAANFHFLHETLKNSNKLKIDIPKNTAPLVYPYLVNRGKSLRSNLIKNKIYCAIYWPDVLNRCKMESIEHYLTDNLVALPIDQRYTLDDMTLIIDKLKSITK